MSSGCLGLRLLVLATVLVAATAAPTNSIVYEYDALGRLTNVTSPQSQTAYVLDAAGNRISVTTLASQGVPGAISVPASSTTGNYTISWGASTGTFTRYELYEATSADFSGQVQVYNGAASSSPLSGKGNGTYYYRARACDAAGCGSYATGANAILVTLPPGAPVSISAPSSSQTGSYSISWGASTGNVTAYELYEATNAGFSDQVLAFNGAALTKAISGKGNGVFYYRVRACNVAACGSYSTSANAVTVTLPPGLPGPLAVPAGSTTGSYTISWGAPSGIVTAYELYEALDPSFTNTVLAYSGMAISNPFTGKGNGTYSYRVRACNGPACSAYRTGPNAITVTLPPGVPGAVSVPAYNNTGSYTVSWSAATGNVTAYEVLESIAFGGEALVYSGTATSIAPSGRTDGTVYSYRVRACNGPACSAYTSAQGAAGIVFVDKTAPTAPAQLTKLNPSLVWSGGSTDTGGSGVGGWYVYRNGTNIATVLQPSQAYTDSAAPANVTLNYTVRAFDRAGNVSGTSNTVSVYTDTIPPTAPTGLHTTVVATDQVGLAWNASTDEHSLSFYEIHRSGGNVFYSTPASFTDQTVSSNTTYTYDVYATDGGGNRSAAAASITVTTLAGAPSVPTMNGSFTQNITGNFSVSWSASTGSVATYVLEEDMNGGGAFNPFTPYTVTAPTASRSFSGKSSGEYRYRVKACTSGGVCSGYSAVRFILVCRGGCQ